ncbi:MAG: dTDP-4-dehydrorhamnose 3,5-epimerase [Ignavibacteriaceae bacterium]
MMKVTKTKLEGLLVIQPDVFRDSRGYFFESFSSKKYEEFGNKLFVQDNISKSQKNTVRGLHYQASEKAQGKLCQVIYGKVLDVAVDIRFGSPTFGHYHSEILSEGNHMQMWIPPGFAHGFSVLSDEAIFHYKCTEFYSKEHERGIRFNDPQLNISWQVIEPIVSEKDLKAVLFKDTEEDFRI